MVAFAPLCDDPYALLFGPGSATGAHGHWSILLAEPDDIHEINGDGALDALPPLARIEDAPPLPFIGGYAGLASYELGAVLDRVPRMPGRSWPDLAFGYFPCAALFDHQRKALWVVGPDAHKVDTFTAQLGDAPLPSAMAPQPTHVQFLDRQGTCKDSVAQVIDLIHAGDIFQANISQGFCINLPDTSTAFSYFRTLCAQSPAPYSAYFRRNAEQALLSNSPEQFFALDPNGRIQTSPIKGTRPRAQDPENDRALAEALMNSPKDRSENLMIVDLMRNDLSKVCVPGSVTVPHHCALHSFANVHHLISTIEGQIKPGKSAQDILAACFPAGSITGAPKIRAMEIIAQFEKKARGPYCGSLGYISHNGQAEFNVLIRSVEYLQDGPAHRLCFRTGGGIVADSDPATEVQEMLDKARAICTAAGADI